MSDVNESHVSSETPMFDGDLPPVEPPSAGFIVQLFVVPGLIVLAVVGVWALFGKLAAGEQDWQSLVAELKHSNEYRRWRGAHGLAQMLTADGKRDASGPGLAQNPIVVRELTQLFEQELARSAPNDKDRQFQEFLARAVGQLDANEQVLPVLREAMSPGHAVEVRKNAILSVGLIADRLNQRGLSLNDEGVVDDLLEVSVDETSLMRQVGAYTLGIVGTKRAQERLAVMLDDPDENARLNAAVGLARNESTEGVRVLESALLDAATPFDPSGVRGTNEVERTELLNDERFQYSLRLKSTLKTVEELAERFTADERAALIQRLEPLADAGHLDRRFRSRASAAMRRLKQVEKP